MGVVYWLLFGLCFFANLFATVLSQKDCKFTCMLGLASKTYTMIEYLDFAVGLRVLSAAHSSAYYSILHFPILFPIIPHNADTNLSRPTVVL